MTRRISAASIKAELVSIKPKSSAGVFAIVTDFLIIFVIVTSPSHLMNQYLSRIITQIFESNGLK
jgi:hypothetical protein